MYTQLSMGNGPFVFILNFKCKWQTLWTQTIKINQRRFTAKMYANSFLFSKQQQWLLWPPIVEPSELNVSSMHIRFSNWQYSDFVASYFNDDLHAATGNHIKHFKTCWYLGAQCRPILGGDPSFLPLENRNMNNNSQTELVFKTTSDFL